MTLPKPKEMSFGFLEVQETRLLTVSGMQRHKDQMKLRADFEIVCFLEIRFRLSLGCKGFFCT